VGQKTELPVNGGPAGLPGWVEAARSAQTTRGCSPGRPQATTVVSIA